jgi:hypothetical protein
MTKKTKKEIRHLIDTNDPELENAFYQILNSELVVCAEYWLGTNKMNI